MKTYELAKVLSNECISEGIYDMRIATEVAGFAVPGQFVMVYPVSKDKILPRPISICETDIENKEIRIVYRVAGGGTSEFSTYDEGDLVKILGPLGNGFPLEKAKGKKAVLIGGGIGVPPIMELSKRLAAEEITTLLGYRNSDLFLIKDFEKYAKVCIATEDGSVGTKGNVLDALNNGDIPCELIYACGPMPMLRAIKKYAESHNIEAYISLEERMACGIGACLGCVAKTTNKDNHSHVNNARVCTEGPVFEAREVDI